MRCRRSPSGRHYWIGMILAPLGWYKCTWCKETMYDR